MLRSGGLLSVSNTPGSLRKELKMGARILTVDDSKTLREMIKFTLSKANFEVSEAVDGESALECLETEAFDLIISDVNMPGMGGIEFVSQTRKHPIHRATPILMLATEGVSDMKAQTKAAGATGWFHKPFDPAKLIAAINKLCPDV
jgi:two-component system chemotaxis response regulator CheY